MRGLDTVDEITPKAPLPTVAKSLTGCPNLGVLVKLKNSARNCSELVSVTLTFLRMARSRFSWLGPRSMPTPQLPKPVPSPTDGGGKNAAALRYPFRRLCKEPDEAGLAPVHSAREKPGILP